MDYKKEMKAAIDMAKKGIKKGEQPYAAVLLADGEIIAKAHNRVISDNDINQHAEIVVLNEYKKLKKRAKELILITTCEPCFVCFGHAVKNGVNKFVFGSSIETAISYGSDDLFIKIEDLNNKYKVEIVNGLLEKECDELFENYISKNHGAKTEQIKVHKYWMKKALKIGKQGMIEKHELPIGVILVAGDEVLYESPTMTYTTNSPIMHGDFYALLKSERKVYSCKRPLVLYSTLEPHLLGFGAAVKSKVDKVVYGLEAIPDGGACYIEKIRNIKEKMPEVIGGVCRKEQYQLLKEFIETHDSNRVGWDYANNLVNIYEDMKEKR